MQILLSILKTKKPHEKAGKRTVSPMNGILALFIVAHGSPLHDKDSTLLRTNAAKNIESDNGGTSDLNDHSDSQCDEWKSFLIEWNLDQFSEQFEDGGWTDISDWHQIDEDELKVMGLQKGHITRFLRNVEKKQRDMNDEEKSRQFAELCGICGNSTMLAMIYMLLPLGILWGFIINCVWNNYRIYRSNVFASLMEHADERMLPKVSSYSIGNSLYDGGTPDHVRKTAGKRARVIEFMRSNNIRFEGCDDDIFLKNECLTPCVPLSIFLLFAIIIGTFTSC